MASPSTPASETLPARPSLLAKASAAVAARPNIALAVIVVLTVVVIATVVYYKGLFFLGPYSKPLAAVNGIDPSPLAGTAHGAQQGAPQNAGDAETQQLIDSINASA